LKVSQHLDSPHCSFEVAPNFCTSKEAHFFDELKIASKQANMPNVKKYSNSNEDDEAYQTIRKPGRNRPKKVNTKSSKPNISKHL